MCQAEDEDLGTVSVVPEAAALEVCVRATRQDTTVELLDWIQLQHQPTETFSTTCKLKFFFVASHIFSSSVEQVGG